MQYVALLRGIGPGNPNMRNEKLRGVFEKLGFKNVQTVISSGNVLFDLPAGRQEVNIQALETKIEKEFPKQLGFKSTTIIRSYGQLRKLAKKNPFKGTKDKPTSRLNVTFFKHPPKKKVKTPFHAKDKSYKIVGMDAGAIYSAIDLSGASTPDVMVWLEKQFGKDITTRTWKTVNRILQKFENS